MYNHIFIHAWVFIHVNIHGIYIYIYLKNSKEIKPVNLKGDQPWIFIGRTDAEAEAPVFWSSDVNRLLIVKVPDAGKDWRQKEKEGVRGWDGWMVSPMQWTWTWAHSGRWWWRGRPGLLQSTGSQRVGHDWGLDSSSNKVEWLLLSF